ncbi:MAG: hypothetical protein LBN38_01520, partial [Verrucomicrobiota bacterium]|nr:hypothetical protein [Verrucomicrobiota bacterium]
FDSRYQFSTKEYDEPTAINYYGYRFYHPELGRWINRDPLIDIAFRAISSDSLSIFGKYELGYDAPTIVLSQICP